MDLRAKRTNEILCEAFTDLLQTTSFENITVNDICETSNVGRSTFYRHFEDKHDFLRYYLTTITDAFVAELEGSTQIDGLLPYAESMHKRLLVFVSQWKAGFRHVVGQDLTILDMVTVQVCEGILERMRREAEEGKLDLSAPPEFVSMYYSAGIVSMMRWWVMDDKLIGAEEMARRCTELLARMVGSC